MAEPASRGRFGRLLKGLARTRQGFIVRLRVLAGRHETLDAESLEEIEELLFSADCGVAVTEAVISGLRQRMRQSMPGTGTDLAELLRAELMASFPESRPVQMSSPHVVVAVGVNGSGKTTTVGKLAARACANGLKVVLAAADTYRAAAVEQLKIWGERAGVQV
ncbi:MAG: signal recognition particle receptor subunit alpha, partial [Acidobacteriota bacterium]